MLIGVSPYAIPVRLLLLAFPFFWFLGFIWVLSLVSWDLTYYLLLLSCNLGVCYTPHMPKTLREVIATVVGAVVAFIGYKLVYALLGGVSNDILRVLLSGIPGALLGVGAMYLILRGDNTQP